MPNKLAVICGLYDPTARKINAATKSHVSWSFWSDMVLRGLISILKDARAVWACEVSSCLFIFIYINGDVKNKEKCGSHGVSTLFCQVFFFTSAEQG